MCGWFGCKNKSSCVGLYLLGVFVHKNLNFWPEYFSAILTENNKMTENYVQKIWVENEVIWEWFLFLAGLGI